MSATAASSSPEPSKESEKRAVPCWQAYASDWIAQEEYATASLAQRGLLFSLLNQCWANFSVPKDHAKMALLLRVPEAEIDAAWGALVDGAFQNLTSDEARLFCPELERQRTQRDVFLKQRAENGRKGGLRTQERAREAASTTSSGASSGAQAPEKKGTERTGNRLLEGAERPSIEQGLAPEHQAWVKDYEAS